MVSSVNKNLWIIRGLPGSGKSTLAVALSKILDDCVHYEADMFHMIGGEYYWKPENAPKSHKWCQSVISSEMGIRSNLIVSNTSLTRKEYQVYIDMAEKRGYTVNMILCQGDYGSIHNVPAHTIEKMKNRFRLDPEEPEAYVYDAESFCNALSEHLKDGLSAREAFDEILLESVTVRLRK